MNRVLHRTLTLVLLSALSTLPVGAADWTNWRGPERTGTSPETNLPLHWGMSDNLAWTLPLPSGGGATPIVTGAHVFLNVVEGDRVVLWRVERDTGRVAWKGDVAPAEGHAHRKHNMATPSPVTDGRRVWVVSGNGIVKAFTIEGQELWVRDIQADYGRFGTQWGYGSSPLLEGGLLYVPVIHGMKTDDPSYLLGLDPATGETRFRVERPTAARRESPDAYTTPAVARRDGKMEIVLTGGDVVTGHDPATGRELWRASNLNPDNEGNYRIVASPVTVGDIVVAPTRVKPLRVLRAFGEGDVSESRLMWSFDRGPDVPTPTTDGHHLYVVTDKGILWCLDLETGEPFYGPQRLAVGTYSSSPLLADGKLYVTNEDGLTSVIKAGPAFELLAENALEGFTLASPVATNGQILLRTGDALYCIGTK